MSIVYDGHIFRWQKAGGIVRYFNEIISRLPPDLPPVIIGLDKGSKKPKNQKLTISCLSTIRPRSITQPLKSRLWTYKYLRQGSVFHPTYYNISSGLQYRDIRCPLIVTVHDLTHARYPDLVEDSEGTLQLQQEAVRRADHIICVSKETEKDLLHFIPSSAGKTSVIYHASSFPICRNPIIQKPLKDTVFLFVGSRGGYKNFMFLLRVFAKAARSRPTISLHIAGPALTYEEKWMIQTLGLKTKIFTTIYPDEQQLRAIYLSSQALLYPSLSEGFGIPPLEAMACGAIVVTSNISSLPEIVGDGGILLDPADEDAWIDCILKIAEDPSTFQGLVERGTAHVTKFSWEKSAEQHTALYRKLAKQ